MNASTPRILGERTDRIYLSPAVSGETMVQNMRAALARGLPQITPCKPHRHIMAMAGGGPSLADTYQKLEGFICAVNGSLAWLLDHGVLPNACAVMDAGAHIPDMVIANVNVRSQSPGLEGSTQPTHLLNHVDCFFSRLRRVLSPLNNVLGKS